jgi:hypothetical protein
LQATVAGFSPAFIPADVSLSAAGFDTFLDGLDAIQSAVSTAQVADNEAVVDRQAQAADIKTTALRVKDLVQSNIAWKRWHKSVGDAADRVRGYALPRKTTPPRNSPPPNTPPKKAGSGIQSQQSFADIEKLFDKLIETVKKIPTYAAPVDSGLAVAELTALREALHTQNQLCNETEVSLRTAVADRQNAFNDKEQGLSAKMKGIKKAVRSQYGNGSAESVAANAVKI